MRSIFKYFKDAMWNYKKDFIICLGLILILTVINTIFPYTIRVFLEKIVADDRLLIIIVGVVFFILLLIVRMITKIFYNVALDGFGGKYIENISKQCYQKISSTALNNLDKIKYNVLKNILFTDVLEVFRVIGNFLPNIISSVLVVVFSLILSFTFEWRITLFLLISLLIGMFLSFFSRKMISKSSKATNTKLKEHNSNCNEFVDSINLVQTNNILDYFTNKSSESIRQFIKTAKKDDKKIYFWSGTIESFNMLFTIILSAMLTMPFFGSSIINLVFFTTLSSIIMEQGQKIENFLQLIIRSTPSFDNINKILCLEPRQKELLLDKISEIKFTDVTFSYVEGNNIFSKINCYFKSGETIRLDGSNGSGKSTFLKLLLGLYKVQNGNITINDQDLYQYSQEELNNQILYVSADEILLNGKILDYINSMCKDVDINKINQGIEYFKIDYFDKTIDNNGGNLSVGQRKKLLLMKLFLRWEDSSVIILDEVSSGLDVQTKQIYEELLNKITSDKSKLVFIVEHNWNNNITINKTIKMENEKQIEV